MLFQLLVKTVHIGNVRVPVLQAACRSSVDRRRRPQRPAILRHPCGAAGFAVCTRLGEPAAPDRVAMCPLPQGLDVLESCADDCVHCGERILHRCHRGKM